MTVQNYTSSTIICPWVSQDPIYIKYHNEEWGRPVFDSFELFEKLCLDGQQAGLSWLTILKKKQGYRDAFCNFNPHEIIKLSPEYLVRQQDNKEIVRNKLKIASIVRNAHGYIKMEQQGINFSDFLWGFIGGEPVVNSFLAKKDVPVSTAESLAMSQELKKFGFNFVGPTICYAFMEAVGMVNDHLVECEYYHDCISPSHYAGR